MTEDEAKTKWCVGPPAIMAATLATLPGAVVMENIGACVGSACMAWRTAEAPRENTHNYHDAPAIAGRWVGNTRAFEGGWQYAHTDTDHEGRKFDLLHRPAPDDVVAGHCGLAGAPR